MSDWADALHEHAVTVSNRYNDHVMSYDLNNAAIILESLEKENAALRAANESVAVCSDHILDIKGIGCLVCENAALREAIKCVWVSWHEWRDDPSENTLYFLEREINAAGELIPPTTDKAAK